MKLYFTFTCGYVDGQQKDGKIDKIRLLFECEILVPRRVPVIGTKPNVNVLLVQLTNATTSPETISMTGKIG